jgi:hypothetical protein
VLEVFFNGFGDFEGFVLADAERVEQRTLRSREPGLGRVALKACRKRWLVIVELDEDADAVRRIILRR